MNNIKKGIGYLILFAPFIFICHFLEESNGFVSWFNLHVGRGINSRLFWNVNISALVITIIVVLAEFFEPSSFSGTMVIFWFSFLMFANAIFHIAGSVLDKAYMPGLITAIILYIPFYFMMIVKIIKARRINISLVIGIAILGALPMLIHGYKILFLGDRLF